MLKRSLQAADNEHVNALNRDEILIRYRAHADRFEEVAAKRRPSLVDDLPLHARADERERPLTARELEVLRLVSDGLPNHEIGTRLFLAEETVKSHVRNVLAKLGAVSRAHAVAIGFRRGMVG